MTGSRDDDSRKASPEPMLPSANDSTAEKIAATKHLGEIILKYIPPGPPVSFEQLLAVMDADDAAWWLWHHADRRGGEDDDL